MRKLWIVFAALIMMFGCGPDGEKGNLTLTMVPDSYTNLTSYTNDSFFLGCVLDQATNTKGWCFFWLGEEFITSSDFFDASEITLLAGEDRVNIDPGSYVACYTYHPDVDCVDVTMHGFTLDESKGEDGGLLTKGADGDNYNVTVTFSEQGVVVVE